MALTKRSVETIKVIAFQDAAVTVGREIYDDYLKNLNEDTLVLDGEPTRFVLKTVLPYDQQQRLDNEKVKMHAEDKTMQIATSSLPEFRAALVAIESPASQPVEERIEFKKDTDGLAAKILVAELNAIGLCADLLLARSFAVNAKNPSQKK